MKSNIFSACRRSVASLAALLILGGLAGVASGQTPPYGTTWDCIMSGSGQQGIAFLTFSNDFTFSGYELLVGKQSSSGQSGGSSNSSDSRSDGGNTGRSTATDTNAPAGSGTNLFGFGRVDGPWHYDTKGRVVGYFLQLVNQQTTISTNYQVITVELSVTNYFTNLDGSIGSYLTNITTFSTNLSYTTNTSGTTNGVSFTAKVTPGKRISLVSSTPNGKVTYKGVPQNSKPIPAPITGKWNGDKKQNDQQFLEFFTLLPTAVQSIYYTTNGEGPGFKFGGVAMVSVQKKIGFALSTFAAIGTNNVPADADGNILGGTLSATIGPISFPKKGTMANTKGFEEPITPVTFKAQRQGP
jgi:hypothetical protein